MLWVYFRGIGAQLGGSLYLEAQRLVFEGPVSRLEKDRDGTGPRPIKTGNLRTDQDRNRGPVFGPSAFWKIKDRAKTGLCGLNRSLSTHMQGTYGALFYFILVKTQ